MGLFFLQACLGSSVLPIFQYVPRYHLFQLGFYLMLIVPVLGIIGLVISMTSKQLWDNAQVIIDTWNGTLSKPYLSCGAQTCHPAYSGIIGDVSVAILIAWTLIVFVGSAFWSSTLMDAYSDQKTYVTDDLIPSIKYSLAYRLGCLLPSRYRERLDSSNVE
mmetsp:Transcript_16532/g.33229  ORF Transcript_16532/g.33229 Transcript_16532/m.33229 type:complete len:161 (-) Transcript_16532:169-651(-)